MPKPRNSAPLLLALALLLAACTTPLPVEPPRRPPLPALAKQPPLPPWCSPTCSDGLTAERESWLQRLTLPAPPASPASASTR